MELIDKVRMSFHTWKGCTMYVVYIGVECRKFLKWKNPPKGHNQFKSEPPAIYAAATDYPWKLILTKEEQSIVTIEKDAAEVKSERLTTLQMLSAIKEGDIYDSDGIGVRAVTMKLGDIIHYGGTHNGYTVRSTGEFLANTWEKKIQEVDFMTAFKAFEEGKSIRSVSSGVYNGKYKDSYSFLAEHIREKWVILDD